MRFQIRWMASVMMLGCLAISFTGCTSRNAVDIQKHFEQGDSSTSANTSPPISKIVCFWQPAEGRNTKGLPTRGVAGQILFFTYGKKTPIKLDDNQDVFIYLFDDQGTPEEQKKPIHRFDFINKSWNAHLREGQIGASYHVFIPYERQVIHQVQCTLNVRLVPKNGSPISSEMTTVTLHGPLKKELKTTARKIQQTNPGKKVHVSTFNRKTMKPAFDRLAKQIHEQKNKPSQQGSRSQTLNEFAKFIQAQQAANKTRRQPQSSGIRQTSGQSSSTISDPRDLEIQRLRAMLKQQSLQSTTTTRQPTPASVPGRGFRLSSTNPSNSVNQPSNPVPISRQQAPASTQPHPLLSEPAKSQVPQTRTESNSRERHPLLEESSAQPQENPRFQQSSRLQRSEQPIKTVAHHPLKEHPRKEQSASHVVNAAFHPLMEKSTAINTPKNPSLKTAPSTGQSYDERPSHLLKPASEPRKLPALDAFEQIPQPPMPETHPQKVSSPKSKPANRHPLAGVTSPTTVSESQPSSQAVLKELKKEETPQQDGPLIVPGFPEESVNPFNQQ